MQSPIKVRCLAVDVIIERPHARRQSNLRPFTKYLQKRAALCGNLQLETRCLRYIDSGAGKRSKRYNFGFQTNPVSHAVVRANQLEPGIVDWARCWWLRCSLVASY